MRRRALLGTIVSAVLILLGCDDSNAPSGASRYTLRIENVTGNAFRTPISPGVWAAHADPDPFFTVGMTDRGEGLEALAEDGDPGPLHGTLDPERSGVFDTALESMARGPAMPGDAFELEVFVTSDAPNLSFAAMVGATNDVFLATEGGGIPLREITAETDVTDRLRLFNAGTEADQAPALGPHQAVYQAAAGEGPREASIRHWTDSSRALPLALDLVAVDVELNEGTYAFTFRNVLPENGVLVTSLSPVFYALHSADWSLFTPGEPVAAPLVPFVEAGDGRDLVNTNGAVAGVHAVGTASQRVDSGDPGLLRAGEAYRFEVTPEGDHSRLSIASMIIASNDAFLAFGPAGIALLDEAGAPRPAADVARDIRRDLGVWDAGTEANEVPGAGLHQGPEGGVDNGDPDPDPTVHPYADITNDVGGPMVGGLVAVSIRHESDTTFRITIANHSDQTAYRALLTPFVWATHEEGAPMFDTESAPTPGLIHLAEDCLTNPYYLELRERPGIGESSVATVMTEDGTSPPIRPGDELSFTVTADPRYRFFNMASMPYPSNDMFVAFDPEGIALLDEAGNPRSDAALAEDVNAHFFAWDVGTEANEAGAGGGFAIPLQPELDSGAGEGDGTVRLEAGVFRLPAVNDLVRVTLTPL